MRTLLLLISLFLFFYSSIVEAEIHENPALSVVPFIQLKGESQPWLSLAISDMIAGHIALTNKFDVLEREKTQIFLKEMELQEYGFTQENSLQRLGYLAKVETVVFGNFSLQNDFIEINLMEMNVKDKIIISHSKAQGKLIKLPEVITDLSVNFLKTRGHIINSSEIEDFPPPSTSSLNAIKHFYEGMRFYDLGEYEDAYAQFLLSLKVDNTYLEARLWSGRMLEYMGHNDQAVLAYKNIFKHYPDKPEAYDAQLLAAKILENINQEEAENYYQELYNNNPALPHRFEALLRLSELYKNKNEYAKSYASLLKIQDFFDQHVKNDILLTNHTVKSRFFSWKKIISRYRSVSLMMIELYPHAVKQNPDLKTPHGSFFVTPNLPIIKKIDFDKNRSLFFNDTKTNFGWNENFYAAILPMGYVATGISVSIEGHVLTQDPKISYAFRVYSHPLSQNYYNTWLGALYGQSLENEILHKNIPFYGHSQKILLFQFIENQSKIKNWEIFVHMQPEVSSDLTAENALSKTFYEGSVTSRILMPQHSENQINAPQYIEQYENKNLLTFSGLQNKDLWIIYANGNLNASTMDLWGTHSNDGKTWQRPELLTINSLSNDFSPKLVRSEDGIFHLFWLSQRRGFGWELWQSMYSKDVMSWSSAQLVNTKESDLEIKNDATQFVDPPSFSVIQDKNGVWIVAFCDQSTNKINLLKSKDARKWDNSQKIVMNGVTFNPALFQDRFNNYWLAAIDTQGMLHMMKSYDLKTWSEKKINLGSHSRHWSDTSYSGYEWLSQIVGYPLTLSEDSFGNLILIFSDTKTGLQFARFSPDEENPMPDLIRDISLEPYAVHKSGKDQWLIVSWQGSELVTRQYKNFLFSDNKKNNDRNPIYLESEQDEKGNIWERRFARTRYVLSDTTAVSSSSDGRVWWGMETGTMSIKDESFFVSDVSMGFFNHFVTNIITCGDTTYFSSYTLDKPIIGSIRNSNLSEKSNKIFIPELKASITAMTCDLENHLVLGTSKGMVGILSDSHELSSIYETLNGSISDLIVLENNEILAGSFDGSLFKISKNGLTTLPFQAYGPKFPVSSISQGHAILWVGTIGGGLYALENNRWHHYSSYNSNFPYDSIKKIQSDSKGVWFIPSYHILSKGLGYFDTISTEFFNPPSHIIEDINDFDIAADRSIWLGSATSGIYRFKKNE